MGRPLLDLKGQVFTYLTVVEFVGRRGNSSYYRCNCRCGSATEVSRSSLVGGQSKSCGCFRAERMQGLMRTHGMAGHKRDKSTKKSPEYKTWDGIKERCLNKNGNGYENYGARGISMAPEWRDSFEAFFAHIGPRPSPKHSIDRVDNTGDYEPGNVRWATSVQQNRNKRSNRLVEYSGRTVCLAEAAELAGLPYYVVKNRIYKGWTVEDALAEPLDMRKSNAGSRGHSAGVA